MKHLLIVGRPGVGKTTLVKRLTQALRGCPIDGFLTEELREQQTRMGFWLSPLDGRQVLLAHRRLPIPTTGPVPPIGQAQAGPAGQAGKEGGVRVGPYRVNVSVLDDVAVSVVHRGVRQARILFLDELGAMELSSTMFAQAVQHAFDRGPAIVATAGVAPLPLLTALKQRKDVELIPLSMVNRALVEEELTTRLRARCEPEESMQALERHADRIGDMIVAGNVPLIDIEIQQAALREAVAAARPDQPSLYQMLYDSRFRRLWQQFHHHAA